MQSLYTRRGAGVLASGNTAGPWNPAHQHGGPVAALLTRALEAEIPPGFAPAFIWAEFLRPVPVGYSEISIEPTREGASVRGLRAMLKTIDRHVAQVSGTWVKTTTGLPTVMPSHTGFDKRPNECEPLVLTGREERGYATAIEIRVAHGTWKKDTAMGVWLKLGTELFAGEKPSPLVRLIALADVCAGIAQPVDIERFTFINADLSVRLNRAPESEWLGFDIETTSAKTGSGIGSSFARIYDEQGYLGTASQTLLLRPRIGAF
jgi:Thioesterase-like superfamily